MTMASVRNFICMDRETEETEEWSSGGMDVRMDRRAEIRMNVYPDYIMHFFLLISDGCTCMNSVAGEGFIIQVLMLPANI